ncbi:uncharacterized protein LOC126797321 [Argentina anserina]|uniref:uncharacterized protein LOC126797321 n=1 Tax=Argentina anserina TaxID=57926 RepID=UPI00217621A9|nr:uncharacterized protein LOC126797321 [Potentilla anserina]
MDISSLCGKSVLENVGCSLGLQCSANQTQHPSSSFCRDLVAALDESLNLREVGEKSLNGGGVGKESSAVKADGDVGRGCSRGDVGGVEKGNMCANGEGREGKCKPKCLNKCATFPSSQVLPPDGSSDREVEEPETALLWLFGEEHTIQGYSRSVSLPSPLKLLSAMKGSREKEGLSTEKLTVKWAPDVYDPPVTLMSHTVNRNKQQKTRNKKNWKRDGKKGQRSNNSRGKDKKQYRKGGASERSHRSLDSHEMITETNDEYGDLVGNREPHSYCGSSFLKDSLTNMHYPVAEAL